MSKNLQQDTPLGAYRYAFGVITDTHLNEDEDRCSSPFDVNRRANRRMRHVVRSLNKRDLAFVVNVVLDFCALVALGLGLGEGNLSVALAVGWLLAARRRACARARRRVADD